MTGAKRSVLGVDKDVIISRLTSYYPQKHTYPDGDIMINGVVLDIDKKNGKCQNITKIRM